MSTKRKVFIGILGVVLVAAVASSFFLHHQLVKSFPRTDGSVEVRGLQRPAVVARDAFGVPRIEAESEYDLMVAVGYTHAQDRLWQMDMARRIGMGRLSELFGRVTLPFDRMFRIVGIRKISEEVEKNMAAESHRRLEAYAAGVNAFITSHKGTYPIEFDLLGYDPEPWTPLHSIMIGRLMAWELNLSWWVDLTLGAIVERIGYEKAREIFPTYPADIAPLVPSAEWRTTAPAALAFLKTAQEYCSFRGSAGLAGGSNAWVVGAKKSSSAGAILANDTHLQLTNPSKWYEMHLVAPDYDVMGFSIPGVPGIVAGRNAHIAWGLTNVMADDADFYIEKIDSTDPTRYVYNGQSLPITIREEDILVRNDTAQVVLIRSTHHGPIVTDIETSLKKTDLPFVASMRWTGAEISDQIEAFNKINRAEDWKQFVAGVKEFTAPGQNFVYGDAKGNIGYWCGVKLPLRSRNYNSTLPLPGWETSSEWQGFVPFEELPHLFNPPEGFIASANNKIVDDSYPYHISHLWEPPSRVQRLREVLDRERTFSIKDFELLQNDQFSHYAREMTPIILEVCRGRLESPLGEEALDYLAAWDFIFSKESIPTAIFQQFLTRLLKNIYEDELGPNLFHDYLILANVPLRVTLRLVRQEGSSWFDNIRTTRVETRNDIILLSMGEAVDALRLALGDEAQQWQWGSLHTLVLQHPFGLQKPLDNVFSIGPFPYGGGATVLTSGEYSFNDVLQPGEMVKPFGVTVGASFRHIVDMANPHEARTVLPSGQSGQVFSDHYSDQTALWLNGAYKTVRSDSATAAAQRNRLTLNPAP